VTREEAIARLSFEHPRTEAPVIAAIYDAARAAGFARCREMVGDVHAQQDRMIREAGTEKTRELKSGMLLGMEGLARAVATLQDDGLQPEQGA